MAYGSVLTDVVQSSTAGTPPQFNDGNGTQTGTLCRAWVNFNGTGTVAIRASFNVSSITDNGVGNYTVNFTTALPDANYATIGSCLGSGGATLQLDNVTRTTTGHSVLTRVGGTSTDVDEVTVSVFR